MCDVVCFWCRGVGDDSFYVFEILILGSRASSETHTRFIPQCFSLRTRTRRVWECLCGCCAESLCLCVCMLCMNFCIIEFHFLRGRGYLACTHCTKNAQSAVSISCYFVIHYGLDGFYTSTDDNDMCRDNSISACCTLKNT